LVKLVTLSTRTSNLVRLERAEVRDDDPTFVVLSSLHETTHTVVVKPNRRLDAVRVLSTDGATRLSESELERTSEPIRLLFDAEPSKTWFCTNQNWPSRISLRASLRFGHFMPVRSCSS
jgi:hypothetical protein